MSPWWIMGLVVLVIGLGLIGGLIEGNYLAPDKTGNLETMMEMFTAETPLQGIPVLGWVASAIYTTPEWFPAFIDMATFDYPFFEGNWVIVRWFFVAITLALVFSIVTIWVRGVGGG